MAVVGLGGYEDALARQLSAGQKKRLSLARLWLSPAPLWLLDEPYANLDLGGIELVNRMVQAHLQEGGAALVTTTAPTPPPRCAQACWSWGSSHEPPPGTPSWCNCRHCSVWSGRASCRERVCQYL